MKNEKVCENSEGKEKKKKTTEYELNMKKEPQK